MVSINTVKGLFNVAKKSAPAAKEAAAAAKKEVVSMAEAVKTGVPRADSLQNNKGANQFLRTVARTGGSNKISVISDSAILEKNSGAFVENRAITVRYPDGSVHTRVYGQNGLEGYERTSLCGNHTYGGYCRNTDGTVDSALIVKNIGGKTHVTRAYGKGEAEHGCVPITVKPKASIGDKSFAWEGGRDMNGITEKINADNQTYNYLKSLNMIYNRK